MAVLNSAMFNGARKQVGGFVLYGRNGETIARIKASQVTNPRTPIQMEQRVRLSNLVSFYRANAAWMKGAFEGKKKKESDYNAFVSNNLSSSLVALTKADVDSGAAVVAPYKVTSGSLGVIEMQLNGTDLVSNLLVGNLTIDANTTVGELSQALIANNNGISDGMQLSVIINLQLAAAGAGTPYINVRAHELIINSNSSELITAFVPDSILEVVGSTTKTLGLSTANLGDGAATFILSRTIGGKTYVSSQSLVFFGSNAIYRAFTSAAQMNAAIQSYGEGGSEFLNTNTISGSNSVVSTLALMGVSVASVEYVAGGTLQAPLDSGDSVEFTFNRALDSESVVSAYYTIGTSATKYNLTSVTMGEGRRTISGSVGATSLPSNSQQFTLVAVVDGDEFPIRLTNGSDGADAN